MPLPRVEIVVIALASPLLIGVYEKGVLIKRYEENKKTSEALPLIFKELLQRYEIERIFYAKGPGSFMAIKLAYIFLETVRIAKGVELVGCQGFLFNENQPIKAMGNLYFVKEGKKIVTKKLEDVKSSFTLPQTTKELHCGNKRTPLYVLPAV